MKKGTFKTIAVIVAFLLLGTAVAACMTQGFKDWNPYGWFDSKEDCEHEYGEDGKCAKCGKEKPSEDNAAIGFVAGGQDIIGNGIALHVIKNTKALNANEGIATVAETSDSYTVTATVYDSSSTANDALQLVDYSMAWASTNSLTVTNYVTMTVDGTKATFTLQQPFSTQIIVTCKSTFDESKKATLTLDYYQRFSDLEFTWNDDLRYTESGSRGIFSVDFLDNWVCGGPGSNYLNYASLKCATANFGIGSISNDIKNIAVTISAADSFLEYFKNKNYPGPYLSGQAESFTKNFGTISDFQISQFDIYNGIWPFIFANTTPSNSNGYKSMMLAGLENTSNQFKLDIVVTLTHGGTVSQTFTLNVNVPLAVSKVSLNSTGYVF